MGKSLRSLLFSLLLLSGCGLEGAPTLRLTLPQEVVAQEGEAGRLSVVLEGRRVREVALRVVGLPSPPPPLRVGLASGRAQVELLLEAPPGTTRPGWWRRAGGSGGRPHSACGWRLGPLWRPSWKGWSTWGRPPGFYPKEPGLPWARSASAPRGAQACPLGADGTGWRD
ncbi:MULTISPECIES: hypothetical protein [Thermus]